MVFVSHANPEENELALWLSLQLASEGYAVWCDLTKLLGGEKFWEDIQEAIRVRTAKFVYILSRASNQKRGTLDELDCAIGTEKRHQLRDFIITVKADDLPYDEVYISVRRLNHIDFKAWASSRKRLVVAFVRSPSPSEIFPCREKTAMPGEDARLAVHQNWVVETKGFDASSDLRNLRVRVRPGVASKRDEFVDQPQLDMLDHRSQVHGNPVPVFCCCVVQARL
jgi:TIR domain